MQMTLPHKKMDTSLVERLIEWLKDPYQHKATVQEHREELDAIHSEIVTLKMSDPSYSFNKRHSN